MQKWGKDRSCRTPNTSVCYKYYIQNKAAASLEVRCLWLCTSNTGAAGLIPGWQIDIPHALCHNQKNPNKQLLLFFLLIQFKKEGRQTMSIKRLHLQVGGYFSLIPQFSKNKFPTIWTQKCVKIYFKPS